MAESIKGLVRVNFSHRGFAKMVDQKALSGFTPNPLALVHFGRFLSTLNIQPQGATTFVSIPEFRGIDYVGYVIEKERLIPGTGTWMRLAEYHVIGARSNSFEDSRVAYGQTYRYRIRAVAKFTTYNDVDALNNTQAAISLLQSIKTALQTAVKANAKALKYIAENAAGLKSKSAAQQAIDIGNAVGISAGNFFFFNVLDPTSTSRLATLQTTVNSWLAKLSSSKPISFSVLTGYVNQLIAAGVVLPKPAKKYYSEYIASCPSRNWQYITVQEEKLPPAPETIKIFPASHDNSIAIYWLAPPDAQRDLAYFTLYRRHALGEPWQILQDKIPLTQASYVDRDVKRDKKYVYALSSTDLHGYKSFLSVQIQAQLNPAFETERKEKPLKWISGGGARPDEASVVLKAFYDPFEQIVAHKNIKLTVSDTFSDDSAKLLLRVKSLDTHETQDISVTLRNVSQ